MSSNITDLALWRYGQISPLLNRVDDHQSQSEILYEISMRETRDPQGRHRKISPETLRKWIYRFRIGGLSALEDRKRDCNSRISVSLKMQDRLFKLRDEHPRWRLSLMLDHLLKTEEWNGVAPSRSSLYRFCSKNSLHRDAPGIVSPARAFQCASFGQLWMADFLHGPKVFHGKTKKKIYLHAIIDDCTRYIVAARFHLSEKTESLFVDLKNAIRRFGIPMKFYTDNGSAYKSRHLALAAARMNISLPHTPPYKPQGRGKIERFFRTVRDRFLSKEPGRTLNDMNRALDEWLAEYHQTEHSSLGTSPLSHRLSVESCCREIPDIKEIDPLFYMEKRCSITKTGTVRVNKREFEIPNSLPSERITIHYLPWDLSQVWYGDNYEVARPLNKYENANRYRRELS